MGLSYDHWAKDDKILEDIRVSLLDISTEKHKMVKGQRCRRLRNKAHKIQNGDKRKLAMKEIKEVEGDS